MASGPIRVKVGWDAVDQNAKPIARVRKASLQHGARQKYQDTLAVILATSPFIFMGYSSDEIRSKKPAVWTRHCGISSLVSAG
jgi:hypothetical protein